MLSDLHICQVSGRYFSALMVFKGAVCISKCFCRQVTVGFFIVALFWFTPCLLWGEFSDAMVGSVDQLGTTHDLRIQRQTDQTLRLVCPS